MAIYFGLAAVVVIAAAVVSYMLWQKMQVDRQKMKMDLYDRRFAALVALGNAIEQVGGAIVVDEFAAPGVAPPLVSNYPERSAEARREPGLPGEVVLAFKFLFDEAVFEQVKKIHYLSIDADDGDRQSMRRLETASAKLIGKIEQDMKVG